MVTRDMAAVWPEGILRALVVLAVLAGAVVIGTVTATGKLEPLYLLALAVLPPALWMVLRSAQNGLDVLAILASGGLLGIVTLPTGTDSKIVISLVLTLGLLGFWLLRLLTGRTSGEQWHPSPITRPVLFFVAVQVLSLVWSRWLIDPLVYVPGSFLVVQVAALVVTCALPLLSLYVVNKVASVQIWRWAVWLTIAIGLLHIVSVLLDLPLALLTDNGARGLFPMWVSSLALALLLFDRSLARWKQGLLLLLLAAFFWRYLVQSTAWLSGWLPLVTACAVVIYFRSRRLFLVLLLAVCVALFVNSSVVYNKVIVSNTEEGSTQRFSIWAMNLAHVQRHPLLGMGPAGYAVYNMTYHPEDARSTHNNYFDILAQSGIVGLAAFVSLAATMGRVGLQNVRRLLVDSSRRRCDGPLSTSAAGADFARALAAATVGGGAGALAGMMLGDWVLPFAYNQTITGFDNALFTWVYLGAIVSLQRLTMAEAQIAAAQEDENVAAPAACVDGAWLAEGADHAA